MKKRLKALSLALAILMFPSGAFAEKEILEQKEADTSIVEEDQESKAREIIKLKVESSKMKLLGLDYIKEKMPNSYKRYQKDIEEAANNLRQAIKLAEEFLYGKNDQKDQKKDKPDQGLVDKDNEKEEKPKTNPGKNPGNPNSPGFRDPKSPAYKYADGRIIGNKNSMIYHIPSGAFYKKVSLENAVFFESAKEARAAGYRQSKR